MADQVMVTKAKLDSLAEVVSAKSGEPLTLTIDGMTDAVLGMELGITPVGMKTVTTNGLHDVTEYAQAVVNVRPKLYEALTVTPNRQTQYYYPTSIGDYDGFANVTVNPIPSNYGLITWNGSVLTVS